LPFLREKNGALSPHKLIAFTGACLPGIWLLSRAAGQDLGAQPLVELTHQTGEWSVRLLFLSLFVSPSRRLFNAPKMIFMRRTLGVAAFAYALAHVLIYVVDQSFDLGTVAREIAARLYLTIGFAAFLILLALGLTSTDRMVRHMSGPRWSQLHRWVYAATVLSVIHFLMQKKLNIFEPTWMAGLLAWLLLYRFVQRRTDEMGVLHLIGLALGASLFTVVAEAAWYGLLTGVDWRRVLQANLLFPDTIRPAWWVLFVTLSVTAASFAAQWMWPKESAKKKLRPAQPG
jgi:sulfoxide reductase heme-binding subunit YedZ